MKLLIKLGGTLLDDEISRKRLASEIAEVARDQQVTVVHGGGKQMTRFLSERGVESKFINGLRVTTPDVIDAVVKVFIGSVNSSLVTALRAAGAKPVGLSGLSGGLVDAVQLDPQLGQVGRPVRSDGKLLNLLTDAGYLPVVACVAGDENGTIFNVNGDQMAVACAQGYGADKLLFLTDVEGVRGDGGTICPRLTIEQAKGLISDGIATGGMQAKLESAISGLQAGVGTVVIAPGARPGIIRQLIAMETVGTALVRS